MTDLDPCVKTASFEHQAEIYAKHALDQYYALFWEMGLGKTKTIIDTASRLHHTGRIQAMIILAPNSVYSNWITQELPTHMAASYVKLLFNSNSHGEKARLRRTLFLANPEYNSKLRILCMSYDGLRTEHGFDLARDVSLMYKTMIVADESTALKNGSTVTAKSAKKIRANCAYAWIATGTPIAQSPFDVHSQVEFLDPDFWKRRGMKSFSAFKTQYGIYEQRRAGMKVFSTCVGYRDVDKLQEMIQGLSSRLLKEDSTVKLPPKTYQTIMFELSPEQRRVYDELRKEFVAELDAGGTVEAALAIVRLTRLQQIASGFVTAATDFRLSEKGGEVLADYAAEHPEEYRTVQENLDDFLSKDEPVDDPAAYEEAMTEQEYSHLSLKNISPQTTFGDDTRASLWADTVSDVIPRNIVKEIVDVIDVSRNPRIKVMLEIVHEASHKIIIWCRFKRDVDNVCAALTSINVDHVRYDGSVSTKDREKNIIRFRDKADSAQVFVANVHSISQGVTLTIAKTMIYYTNSFSPEKRLQSEDRFHRIGQDSPVLIIDLVAADTVDERLIEGLRKKYEIAASVMGDRYREWIAPIKYDE